MMRISNIQNTLVIFLGGVILLGCIYFDPQNTVATSPSVVYVPPVELTYTKTPIGASFMTPTKSIVPTMDLQAKNEILSNIFENNGGCQLPCYWGFMPGESSWNVTSSYLATFGKIYGPGGTTKVASYGVVFEGVDDPFADMSPTFWVQQDVIKAIGTNSSWIQKNFDYSLSGLLGSLDVPEQIWIRSVTDVPDDQPFYYLVLFYTSKGILVELKGNAEFSDNYVSLCPQNFFSRSPYPPGMILWDPKEKAEFVNFGIDILDDDLGWIVDEYRLLQDVSVSKMLNEEFYNLYIDQTTNMCINVLTLR